MKNNNPFFIRMIIFWLIAALAFICLTGMRDPTQPPEGYLTNKNDAISTKSMNLSGIFIYPTYRMAIINGQNVKEGDRVGEYVVTTINKDTVELTGPNGTMVELNLATNVKQTTDEGL